MDKLGKAAILIWAALLGGGGLFVALLFWSTGFIGDRFDGKLTSPDQYNLKLSLKLKEIEALESYNNGVVVMDEDSNYGNDFPRWDSTADYYEEDVVTFPGALAFRAIADNKAKNPTSSPDVWRAFRRHPYFFLRDSATNEELVSLLISDHPYIRAYACGALTFRRYYDLFPTVVDNLYDTTRIREYTGHYESYVCPADLMLQYTASQFTAEQKDALSRLIMEKYNHLVTLDEILLFHKAAPTTYPLVKAIVNKGIADKFGLIALSQYCKQEDIEIIRKGFDLDPDDVIYQGYRVFFKAIESCPNKSFKEDLIKSKPMNVNYAFGVDEYYVRALASYKDEDCLLVLQQLANNTGKVPDNLATIYNSMKTHYSPIYDGLMKEIVAGLGGRVPERQTNYIEDSPWNY